MAIYRTGTFLVPTANAAYTLNLGFVPSVFRCYDLTLATVGDPDATAEMARAYWDSSLGALSTPATLLETATAGVLTLKSLTTTGIAPYQTPDNLLFVPNSTTASLVAPYQANFSTNLVISNATPITKAANAEITATHAFQTSDIGVTVVTFHGIRGMTQMNNLSGVITGVTGTTKFTVNINSTNFSTHVPADGAVANVITGAPTNTLYGNQSLPTSEANLGFIGLTIGTGVMGATGVTAGDTFFYEAILASPATGP